MIRFEGRESIGIYEIPILKVFLHFKSTTKVIDEIPHIIGRLGIRGVNRITYLPQIQNLVNILGKSISIQNFPLLRKYSKQLSIISQKINDFFIKF